MTVPKATVPRVEDVEADGPYTLRLRWGHGGESTVDASGMIDAFGVYAPLRADLRLFEAVTVGEYGAHVAWSDDVDMAATTLWRLAQEQSGATLSAEEFRGWRKRQTHTLDTAAKALGVSRRMVAYYDKGEKPIPRTVALATMALEMGVE